MDIAIATFGDTSHIMTDKAHGFIRAFQVTAASAHDGAPLKNLVRGDILATGVWADTAYRSKKNEAWRSKHGLVSHIHRKKPKGKPMPAHIRRGNVTRSKTRAFVEHVFAEQESRMGLKIRTIGLARANIADNIRRLIHHHHRITAPA